MNCKTNCLESAEAGIVISLSGAGRDPHPLSMAWMRFIQTSYLINLPESRIDKSTGHAPILRRMRHCVRGSARYRAAAVGTAIASEMAAAFDRSSAWEKP